MQTTGYRNAGTDRNLTMDLLKGAVAGAAAIWVMDRVDWFMYSRGSADTLARTIEARPAGMDPAHLVVRRVSQAFGREVPISQPNVAGVSVHYSFGIVPGALYSAMQPRTPSISSGRGMLYGLGLFLAHDEGINTVCGLAGRPGDYPWQAHARGLISHLVYGLTLDAGLRLMNRGDHSQEVVHGEASAPVPSAPH